ncbi:MAG: hypothetical protein QXD23_03920, partial [Candidatus Micrarchaeaceae archaeon]
NIFSNEDELLKESFKKMFNYFGPNISDFLKSPTKLIMSKYDKLNKISIDSHDIYKNHLKNLERKTELDNIRTIDSLVNIITNEQEDFKENLDNFINKHL